MYLLVPFLHYIIVYGYSPSMYVLPRSPQAWGMMETLWITIVKEIGQG